MKRHAIVAGLVVFLCCGAFSVLAAQKEYKDMTPAERRQDVHNAVVAKIAQIKKADPGIDRFFKSAAGYVVFPSVGKAGFIVGGGHGTGELFEKGHVVGAASITFGSVGLQAGVQEFSQIVFFKDRAAVERFKENKFEFAANASAVIITAGASKGADYRDGVVVFTQVTSGAMVEAALGTQKFSFEPDKASKK
jgi:lipid-binding SYLF domain-containing protein